MVLFGRCCPSRVRGDGFSVASCGMGFYGCWLCSDDGFGLKILGGVKGGVDCFDEL